MPRGRTRRRVPGGDRAARPADRATCVSSFVTQLVAVVARGRRARRRRAAARSRGSGTIAAVAGDHDPARPSGPRSPADRARRSPRPRSPSAAAHVGGVPVTLAPGPRDARVLGRAARRPTRRAARVVDGHARRAATLERCSTGPYSTIDVPALERDGLGDDAALELAQGSIALGQELDTAARLAHDRHPPLDPAVLARLRARARSTASSSSTRRADRRTTPPQFTPARPFTLAERRPPVRRAVQTDDGSKACSDGRRADALRAAQVLAGLSIVAIEAAEPDAAASSIDMPTRWDPAERAARRAPRRALATTRCSRRCTPHRHLRLGAARRDRQRRRSSAGSRRSTPSAPTVNPAEYRDTRDNLERVRDDGRRRTTRDRRRATATC